MFIVAVFVLGVIVGAATTLRVAWYAMTPNFRLLVRASIAARRLPKEPGLPAQSNQASR